MLQYFNTINQSLPIGSVFWFSRLKAETEQVNNRDHSLVTHIPETSSLPKDNKYTPETIGISEEIIEEATVTGSSLRTVLTSSPFAY